MTQAAAYTRRRERGAFSTRVLANSRPNAYRSRAAECHSQRALLADNDGGIQPEHAAQRVQPPVHHVLVKFTVPGISHFVERRTLVADIAVGKRVGGSRGQRIHVATVIREIDSPIERGVGAPARGEPFLDGAAHGCVRRFVRGQHARAPVRVRNTVVLEQGNDTATCACYRQCPQFGGCAAARQAQKCDLRKTLLQRRSVRQCVVAGHDDLGQVDALLPGQRFEAPRQRLASREHDDRDAERAGRIPLHVAHAFASICSRSALRGGAAAGARCVAAHAISMARRPSVPVAMFERCPATACSSAAYSRTKLCSTTQR